MRTNWDYDFFSTRRRNNFIIWDNNSSPNENFSKHESHYQFTNDLWNIGKIYLFSKKHFSPGWFSLCLHFLSWYTALSQSLCGLKNKPLPSFQHPIVKKILVYRYTKLSIVVLLVRSKFCESFVCLDKQFFQEEQWQLAMYFPLLLFDSGSSLVSSKNDTPWYHRWI